MVNSDRNLHRFLYRDFQLDNSSVKRINAEIEEKRPFTQSEARQVIMFHVDAKLHTARSTKSIINSMGWEVLPQATYSLDMAPSDYHLFRTLQHYLSHTHFKSV